VILLVYQNKVTLIFIFGPACELYQWCDITFYQILSEVVITYIKGVSINNSGISITSATSGSTLLGMFTT
jgi:hypothetical protein